MKILTLDFETYYDDEYSLSKMTTEQYVRDPRFEAIGASVKIGGNPGRWYTGPQLHEVFAQIPWDKFTVAAHHAAFDLFVLAEIYGRKPKFILDTLSMARPFHNLDVGGSLSALAKHYGLEEKGTEVVAAKGKRLADFTQWELEAYGRYCVKDGRICYELVKLLAPRFTQTELIVIDQLIRMFTEPCIVLDSARLHAHYNDVVLAKEELMEKCTATLEELMSNDKFAQFLTNLGVEPPMKNSPAAAKRGEVKMTYAFAKTDQGMIDLLDHPSEEVQALVAARMGVKSTLAETRALSLMGVAERGPLPIMLNYYKARTGRLSGGEGLNLQNFPSRNDKTLKQSLLAPEGYLIGSADSSQIEARLIAYVAGQWDLVEAFREGRDVYSEFASEVYGRTITKADKVERFVGKTCILGLGYGMGAAKLRRTLELGQGGIKVFVTLEEAERIVRMYRERYPMIARLWRTMSNVIMNVHYGNAGEEGTDGLIKYDAEGIKLPSGLYIRYPALKPTASNWQYISEPRHYRKWKADPNDPTILWEGLYGGKATENLIQALAALAIREQMVSLRLKNIRVVFQVHDEIVCLVSKSDPDKDMKVLEEVMSTPPKWAPLLPIACESGYAENYGDA